MSDLMSRRILKAKQSVRCSVESNKVFGKIESGLPVNRPYESSTKRKYEEVLTPNKLNCSTRAGYLQTNTPSKCLSTRLPNSAANDRLKKYRSNLSERKNEVVKVHHVLNDPPKNANVIKDQSLDSITSTSPSICKTLTNTNNLPIRISSAKNILGKRTHSIDKVQIHNSDTCKRRIKISDICEIPSVALSDSPEFKSKKTILESGAYDEDIDMDWSPIDHEEVVSNIQKLRDSREKTHSTPDFTSSIRETKTIPKIPNLNPEDKTLYIVVDTNIFISHLKLIEDILVMECSHCDPVIYIPWMVLQELDYFKDRKAEASVMRKSAIRAVNFINQKLMDKHVRLKGQTVEEALKQTESSSNPDDNILFCCMELAKTSNSVILLSNDTNLRNKALINKITSHGPKSVLSKLKDSNNKKMNNATSKDNAHKINEISRLLANTCTEIIILEMEEAYGSALFRLISKPPWDLKQSLIYIKRFWSPVFSIVISQKQCLKIVEDLLSFIQITEDLSTEENMVQFVKLCLSLCVYFKNCLTKYQKCVITCINNIQKVMN